MSDLIDRQDTIKTLCERRCGDKPKGCPSGFCTESLAVDCIPSAQRKGHWVDLKGGGCCCSECGKYALDEIDGNYIHVASKSNYCPHCGAKMEVEHEAD